MTSNYLLRRVLHLVYPNVCIVCESAWLERQEPHICASCRRGFDRFSMPEESTIEMLTRIERNFGKQSIIDDALAHYRFYKEGLLQKVIHAFKYDHLPKVAISQGMELGDRIYYERRANFDAIVPLPLHPVRLIERGYNQAEKIAEGISKRLNVPIEKWVRRAVNTTSQTHKDLQERQRNMKNVFECFGSVTAKRILLVDDVFTTGSTLLSCAMPLKAAGAAHITVAALAITTD
jgi:ComF family protein